VTPDELAAVANREAADHLPGHLEMVFVTLEPGRVLATMPVTRRHMAVNGFLHAGALTTLADTVCATGCKYSLPEGAANLTTVELKVNFLGTVREGRVSCEGRMVHGGRTTQVWDASVTSDGGKVLALFRATQMILYPRSD
jgi:1,4-dihydroxy-2-naphthoyl-CoA hydrolase